MFCRQFMLRKEGDLTGLRSWLGLASDEFAQKEQSPYVEGLRDAMRVSGAIPHGGELVRTYLQAGFFPDFSGNGLGRAFVHVSPSTRQRPAMPIFHFTNEQHFFVLETAPRTPSFGVA